MPKKFSRITVAKEQVSKSDLNRLQDNLQAALDPLSAQLQLKAIQQVNLISGQVNNIGHGLGIVPISYVVGNLSAPATITSAKNFDATFLYLNTSSNVTLDLIVVFQ